MARTDASREKLPDAYFTGGSLRLFRRWRVLLEQGSLDSTPGSMTFGILTYFFLGQARHILVPEMQQRCQNFPAKSLGVCGFVLETQHTSAES